jgi:hypothetical protein
MIDVLEIVRNNLEPRIEHAAPVSTKPSFFDSADYNNHEISRGSGAEMQSSQLVHRLVQSFAAISLLCPALDRKMVPSGTLSAGFTESRA